jgi:CDP-6-deoxy-D-xylo-4-hexulose-3-dehydrase
VNIVRHAPLKSYAESFRDWGRDCWCPSGKDNTCGKRFGWNLGELPQGYDHKDILQPLRLQPEAPRQPSRYRASSTQKTPSFHRSPQKNWEYLRSGLNDLGEFFDFSLPTHATSWQAPDTSNEVALLQPSGLSSPVSNFSGTPRGCRTDCSWFGFMLRIKHGAPFTHTQLARHLDENKIGNRMLSGGNLLRQPLFAQLRRDRPEAFRTIGHYPGADSIMNTAIFLGTYPGLTREMLDDEIQVIREFVRSKPCEK